MIADPDTGQKRVISDVGRCPFSSQIVWSPAGDRLACHFDSSRHIGASAENLIAVIHLDMGLLKVIRWVDAFRWSSSGDLMAYRVFEKTMEQGTGTLYVADRNGGKGELVARDVRAFDWSPVGSRLAFVAVRGLTIVYDATTRRRRNLGDEGETWIRWVRGGRALLADGMRDDESYLTAPESRRIRRRLSFRPTGHVWYSRDGWRALRTSPSSAGLSLFDFARLREIPIRGSKYRGLGDDDISVWEAGFSPDGSQVFWTELGEGDWMRIFRARTDGTGLTQVAKIDGLWIKFSPQVDRIAYLTAMVPGSAGIYETAFFEAARLDGSQRRRFDRARVDGMSYAWRPGFSPGR